MSDSQKQETQPMAETTGAEERAADPVSNLEFHAGRCEIYHQARQGFLGAWHRALMGFAVLGGNGIVFMWIRGLQHDGTFTLIVTCAVMLDLVFALPARAKTHALLASRFAGLRAAELRGADGKELLAQLDELYGQEPPSHVALDAIAHNQMCNGLGRPNGCLVVPLRYRLLKNVFRFDGATFEGVTRKLAS